MAEPGGQSDDEKLGQGSSRAWLASHPQLAALLLILTEPTEGEPPGKARLRRTVAIEMVLRWLGPDGLVHAHKLAAGGSL